MSTKYSRQAQRELWLLIRLAGYVGLIMLTMFFLPAFRPVKLIDYLSPLSLGVLASVCIMLSKRNLKVLEEVSELQEREN